MAWKKLYMTAQKEYVCSIFIIWQPAWKKPFQNSLNNSPFSVYAVAAFWKQIDSLYLFTALVCCRLTEFFVNGSLSFENTVKQNHIEMENDFFIILKIWIYLFCKTKNTILFLWWPMLQWKTLQYGTEILIATGSINSLTHSFLSFVWLHGQ